MSKNKTTLEIEKNSLQARLQFTLHMLAKAKNAIIARRQENSLLKEELLHKTTLLHQEMLAHEETNKKLAKAIRQLTNKFSHTALTISRDYMAQCRDGRQHNSEL